MGSSEEYTTLVTLCKFIYDLWWVIFLFSMPAAIRTTQYSLRLWAWLSTMLVFVDAYLKKGRVRKLSFDKRPQFMYICSQRGCLLLLKWSFQILSDSGILRVAWNTVDPYTLPASHHIFFRSNGIIKCDRNIKYSRAALGFKFWNSRGLWRPIFCQFHLRSRASIEIFVLDIHNIFLLGEQLSLLWIQTISYL